MRSSWPGSAPRRWRWPAGCDAVWRGPSCCLWLHCLPTPISQLEGQRNTLAAHKWMFWSRVAFPYLTYHRISRNHRVRLIIVVVSLLFHSMFHCSKVPAHSFDGCGRFCLLPRFCQCRNKWIHFNQPEKELLSWVTVSDSSCCLGENYALRREGWFTQMTEWMKVMLRSDRVVLGRMKINSTQRH